MCNYRALLKILKAFFFFETTEGSGTKSFVNIWVEKWKPVGTTWGVSGGKEQFPLARLPVEAGTF